MRFDCDDNKSELLKRDRGLSLEECVAMFLAGHVSDQKSDVPEQYFATRIRSRAAHDFDL